MKEYGPEEFKDIAISLLERLVKEDPSRIEVAWTKKELINSIYMSRPSYITIFEHSVEETNRPQECIKLRPLEWDAQYLFAEDVSKNLEKVISELKKQDRCNITICARALKKLDEMTLFIKLFDMFFIVKITYPLNDPFETGLYWFEVYNEYLKIPYAFYRLERKEALAELL